jgi:hypothetical protein
MELDLYRALHHAGFRSEMVLCVVTGGCTCKHTRKIHGQAKGDTKSEHCRSGALLEDFVMTGTWRLFMVNGQQVFHDFRFRDWLRNRFQMGHSPGCFLVFFGARLSL